MIWILGCLAAALAALLGAAAWGSEACFHPPKMLPMEIWPDRYGLAYEKVEFRSADGVRLSGWIIPAASPTDRTLVLLHGWGDNKGDLLQHVHFLAAGFNLLLFDYRQHGESGGSRSTIGALETRDAAAAMEFLRRTKPAWRTRLGVYGLSMGASLAAWVGAEHPEVKALAFEAPFPSFNRVVGQWTSNNFGLPYFPFAWLTLALIRLRLGFDPEPYSPIYHVHRISPRPVFFVAGEMDALMPPAAVREVYERAGQPKEFWIVPGAAHGKCEDVAGEEYRRRLAGFFDRHL